MLTVNIMITHTILYTYIYIYIHTYIHTYILRLSGSGAGVALCPPELQPSSLQPMAAEGLPEGLARSLSLFLCISPSLSLSPFLSLCLSLSLSLFASLFLSFSLCLSLSLSLCLFHLCPVLYPSLSFLFLFSLSASLQHCTSSPCLQADVSPRTLSDSLWGSSENTGSAQHMLCTISLPILSLLSFVISNLPGDSISGPGNSTP